MGKQRKFLRLTLGGGPKGAVTHLAVFEGFLSTFAVIDVEAGGDDADDAAAVIQEGKAAGHDPHAAARGIDKPFFFFEDRLAGGDDGFVLVAVEAGDFRREEIGIGLADGIAGGWAAADEGRFLVADEEAAFTIFDVDELREMVDEVKKKLALLLKYLVDLDASGYIVGEDETGLAPPVVDIVGGDFGIDECAVFALVQPDIRQRVAAGIVGDRFEQAGHFILRTNILDGHGEEFVTGIAVLLDGSIVDIEEGEGFHVGNPHGLWVGEEVSAVAILDVRGAVGMGAGLGDGAIDGDHADDFARGGARQADIGFDTEAVAIAVELGDQSRPGAGFLEELE